MAENKLQQMCGNIGNDGNNFSLFANFPCTVDVETPILTYVDQSLGGHVCEV